MAVLDHEVTTRLTASTNQTEPSTSYKHLFHTPHPPYAAASTCGTPILDAEDALPR